MKIFTTLRDKLSIFLNIMKIKSPSYRHHELNSVDEYDEHDEVGVYGGGDHLPQLVTDPFLVVRDVLVLGLHLQGELYTAPLWECGC